MAKSNRPITLCSVTGCPERVHGDGYCRLHRRRWLKTGDPGPVEPRRPRVGCTQEGCPNPHYAKGLCKADYLHSLKWGDVDFVHPRYRSEIDRFWAKVDKSGPVPEHVPHLGECWIWTANRVGKDYEVGRGYGQFGRGRYAHHFSWVLHNGPVPAGLWVLHRCDNTLCVRPDHLFLGTASDNVQDMLAKGRGRYQRWDHGG